MNRLSVILPLVLVGLMLILLAVGLGMNPREVPSPLIGKPAPDFRLPQLGSSQEIKSLESLAGRPAIVNVWASWCVACLEEHPVLLQLASQGGIPIYGLNYKDKADDAQRWLAQHGNPYRWSVQDSSGTVGIDWGVYGVPETFMLDAKGIIRHKHVGPVTETIWREELGPLWQSLVLAQ